MVRATSVVGRSVALLVSVSLAVTSCAEGAAFGFATLGEIVQQLAAGDPPVYTDIPVPLKPVADARRDARGRGGVWSAAALRDVEDIQAARASHDQRVGPSLLPPPDGGQPDPYNGSPWDWELSFDGQINAIDYSLIINSNTGNALAGLDLVSLDGRGGMGVGVTLYHNSRSPFVTDVGKGWSWTFDMSLFEGTETVIVKWPDGRSVPFVIGAGTYTPPLGVDDTLVFTNNEYLLKTPDGTTYRFDGAGFLLSITDRAANSITVQRNGSRVSSVQDPTGRHLTVNRDGQGRIVSFADWSGRLWTLERQGDDLWRVGYPPLGGTTYYETFEYADGRIVKRTDRRGKESTFGYDVDGKALWFKNHLLAQWSIGYGSSSATYTNPYGHTQTHNYSAGMVSANWRTSVQLLREGNGYPGLEKLLRGQVVKFFEKRGLRMSEHAITRILQRVDDLQEILDIMNFGGGYWDPVEQTYQLYSSKYRRGIVIDKSGKIVTILTGGRKKSDRLVACGRNEIMKRIYRRK